MSGFKNYDPNGPGVKNGRFIGLPFSEEEAGCILFSVPWEVTTSYGAGTAGGPENILEASAQLDLYDPEHPETWKKGIFMTPSDPEIRRKSDLWRTKAEHIIDRLESGTAPENLTSETNAINTASEELNRYVFRKTTEYLDRNKKILLIGGDHSTPFGFYQAIAARESEFGILQIDAHCDFRKAYEGFEHSHASIMYNAVTRIPQVKKLVQVGIRDLCPEEAAFIQSHPDRVHTYFMSELSKNLFEGRSWQELCEEIVSDLPEKVHLSFDIDGLEPFLCPNTGTPVPGGLQYQQAIFLLEEIRRSGRTVLSADLCETAGLPHEWDGNVGARLAYKLALLLLDA